MAEIMLVKKETKNMVDEITFILSTDVDDVKMEFDDGIFERAAVDVPERRDRVELLQRDPLELSRDERQTISGNRSSRQKVKRRETKQRASKFYVLTFTGQNGSKKVLTNGSNFSRNKQKQYEQDACDNSTEKCDICQMSFDSSVGLEMHVTTVHGGKSTVVTSERVHRCNLCPEIFSSIRDLENHFDDVHMNLRY